MKKLLYMASFLALVFTSCDPMEDVYSELDNINKGTENIQSIDYTLTADDYSAISKLALKSAANAEDTTKAKAIASLLSFSDSRPVADYIPAYFNEKYKTLDPTSAVRVTYTFDTRDLEYLTDYTGAAYFNLGDDEYASVGETTGEAGFFTPAFPAEDHLNDILKVKYADAVKGDVVLVSYDSRETNYDPSEVDVVTVFEADFSENLDQFEQRSVAGDQIWKQSSYSGAGYAKMSGYADGARHDNEDWMITSEIDLTATPDAILNFSQAQNFLSGDWQQTFIYITEGYTAGDALDAAKWTEVVLADENKPAGNSYSYVESGDISLSAYNGKKIHIAFVYKSAAPDDASTWQINQLSVKGFGRPEGNNSKIYYAFDGSDWATPTGVYNLQRDDYTQMGSGPGAYGNFSSSVLAEDYLPTFLSINKPYAQEGDVMVMIYKYYSGGTKTIAAEYTYSGGMWNSMPEKIDQFVYAGTTIGWIFDPTVSFTMTSADHALLYNYVVTQLSDTYAEKGDREYYYGANSKYVNFGLQISYRESFKIPGFEGLSEEKAITLTYTRMAEGVAKLLELKYPDAVATVNGIDIYYIVTCVAYENDASSNSYSLKFKCTKSGPNPEFTYIEGLPE